MHVSDLLLSLVRTPVMGGPSRNAGRSHAEILNVLTSAKTRFPDEVTGFGHLSGGYNPADFGSTYSFQELGPDIWGERVTLFCLPHPLCFGGYQWALALGTVESECAR